MVADTDFARAQMAWSLGFHIIFAVVGIGMPVLMAMAEARWIKTRDPVWKDLAKRWAKGTAILFAVGAVSGTALSFELGLLWPTFMATAGPLIGFPFALEGFAFFMEAIFLGVYLYGWDRVPERIHWLSGVAVAVSGALSGIFVVTVNAWMNTPTGFRVDETGALVDIDPVAAMLSPAAYHQVTHMAVAAYTATGFAVAGIHAYYLRKGRNPAFHRKAFALALLMAIVAAPLSVATGHMSGEAVAEQQPAKFAAMEAHYESRPCAPLRIGGIPDDKANTTRYAIEIPCGLSLLAAGDPDHNVTGLADIPLDERPPVWIVHTAFDVMVLAGLIMLALAAWAATSWIRRRTLPTGPRLLTAFAWASPLGFLAVEAGWVVTEVGRQPWIIHGVMRVEDAVTPMPNLWAPFLVFVLLYVFLAAITAYLLHRQMTLVPETPPIPPEA